MRSYPFLRNDSNNAIIIPIEKASDSRKNNSILTANHFGFL